MPDRHPPDLIQALRAARHAEFETLRRERLPEPTRRSRDEHLASATQVLPDAQALLNRIESAQTAMTAVLEAWHRDPGRHGAHLLARDAVLPHTTAATTEVAEPLNESPTLPWDPLAESMPDTVPNRMP